MDDMENEEFLSSFRGNIVDDVVDRVITHLSQNNDFLALPIGPPLVISALSAITQNEEKWKIAIRYIVRRVPTYATGIINEMIKQIPCLYPSVVGEVFEQQFLVAALCANSPTYYRQVDMNICAVLGCIADKMAGAFSAKIFTTEVWEYLLRFLVQQRKPQDALMALTAIEKFAITAENKIKIDVVFKQAENNPLIRLSELVNSEDEIQHQLGYCARWALDNTFTVPGRELTYLSLDMSGINVILSQRTTYFMKISPDGLEVRCDTYGHGSVRTTGEVKNGSWYYEVTLITAGAMRIGFANTEAEVNDNYIVGSGSSSLGYDGSAKFVWGNTDNKVMEIPRYWKEGDVVGLFMNIDEKTMYLMLDNVPIKVPVIDFFGDFMWEKRYYPAATLAPYQQCRFNFGSEPFVNTPPEANFSTFNDFCKLTAEEKMVKPKTVFQSENSNFNDSDDACIICYDNTSDTKAMPCGHDCYCKPCISKYSVCPVCCADIIHYI